ncbi:unnamed protein product, partial [Meganyctiphanes norvegica]|uniref:Enoyl-CoA delta isomerase 2, mitochondrial n=1 Tax=Meganyctiphanes norvegica TaxID=48144 RepID=A0AAV2SVT4_MEGNR
MEDSKNKKEHLAVSVKDGVRIIRFNRPEKKNALDVSIMTNIVPVLNEAAADSNTVITVITGTGEYFTAGNDMNNFMSDPKDVPGVEISEEGEYDDPAKTASTSFGKIVTALIDFPKPLIAIVNGPAIGFGVTMLGLCDVVYASDSATFHTPFMTLALCPEGSSSFTFPNMMGPQNANEMLMFGRKITAKEAQRQGLVAKVYPHESLDLAWAQVYQWAKLPPGAMITAKALIRDPIRKQLHKANETECNVLIERFKSDEAIEAIINFLSRKSKL